MKRREAAITLERLLGVIERHRGIGGRFLSDEDWGWLEKAEKLLEALHLPERVTLAIGNLRMTQERIRRDQLAIVEEEALPHLKRLLLASLIPVLGGILLARLRKGR